MPFTKDQLDNIEKKFAEFKELYPCYHSNGLLDYIKDIVVDTNYQTLPNSELPSLSIQGKEFLSKNFSINLNQHPSLVGFLADGFYAAALDEEELKEFRAKIRNPVTFENIVLDHSFFIKELSPHIQKIEENLGSLINQEALHKQFPEVKVDGNARLFNQIIFFFGTPLDYFTNSAKRSEGPRANKMADVVQDCYAQMIGPDSNVSDIVDDLLFNKDNLPNSLKLFFDDLAERVSFGENEENKEYVRNICDNVQTVFLNFYQENPSPFVLFKPKYDTRSIAEEEVKAIRDAALDSKQGTADFESFVDNSSSDFSNPPADLLYFSDKESRAMANMEKLTRHNSEELSQLSLELLKLYKKQLSIPETQALFARLPIASFTSELLLNHYTIGDAYNPYCTGDFQLDKILGIAQEAFLIKGGRDVFDLQKYSESLRPEIKKLKTRREINEKANEYFESGLHERINNVLENHLKPFCREIAESAPDAMAEVSGNFFYISQGFEQVIAKTSEIADNFKRRYQEVSEEISLKQEREEAAEIAQQAELTAKLEKEAADLKAFHAEMQSKKQGSKKSAQGGADEISCGDKTLDNAKLVEMQWSLKGNNKQDEAFNRPKYKIVMTKEIYDLISSTANGLGEDIKCAVESGFIPTGGRGRSGIKPMDHSEKINGHVIAEVKLRGNKRIKSFLGNSSVAIGDIRLCGALKDGIFLISEISQHGEHNEELRAKVEKISKEIRDGAITLKSASTTNSVEITSSAQLSSAKSRSASSSVKNGQVI